MSVQSSKFRTGKGGKVIVNNANLTNREWSTKWTGERQDVSNFESNGRKVALCGLTGLDFANVSRWDASAMPLASPPGLYPRDDGTAMKLYTAFVTDPNSFWSIPSFAIFDANVKCSVDGTVDFDYSGCAQEDFAQIAGAAGP